MKWEEFLKIVEDLAIIETEALLAGVLDPLPIKVAISRWEKSGKLIQLRRGMYLLAEPYRKISVDGFYIASLLKRPSYLSLQKALEYYDLIPEKVTIYTSVTPKRQAKFISQIGTFLYRHIKETLFWGYTAVNFYNQIAFIAMPEKALLDLIYLDKIKVSFDYLEGLRLQNLEKIEPSRLFKFAQSFNSRSILLAAGVINEYLKSYKVRDKML